MAELMVAVAILGVAILGFFGAFQYISKSIRLSRARTLATNLAQEKVENLKNISYYTLLITTAASVDSSVSPSVTYDTLNYPAENIDIGGITFTRYTHVALAQIDNNVVSTMSYTYPDTGMKKITVNILWSESGSRKRMTLSNLLENPNINPLDSTLSGTVNKAIGGALEGALVKIEENPDWNATTDASGQYSFRVYHGTYTVRVSSDGYYDAASSAVSADQGGDVTVPAISMSQIATGTIVTHAWMNDHLLISQVVVATVTQVSDLSFQEVEYIELFNPTTAPINISPASGIGKSVLLIYGGESGVDIEDDDFALVYVSTYVPPKTYYLIASNPGFYVAGGWRTADAYYGTANSDYLINTNAGAVGIFQSGVATGGEIDVVGWSDNGTTAPHYEGTPIPDSPIADGIGVGNQIVRISSPLLTSDTYGKAYDSDYNNLDFLYPYSGFSGLVFPPRSVVNGSQTVIAGRPAVGAFITSYDSRGPSTGATTQYISSNTLSIPYAKFVLLGVATGTFNVLVASGSVYQEYSNVTVTQNARTVIPNGSTSPAWDLPNMPHVKLTSSSTGGFITGVVTNINNAPLSGIQVSAGGVTKTTGSNGRYLAAVSSGTIIVTVNTNNANPTYVQALYQPTITTGQLTVLNVILSQGGSLTGYATSGTTPLPGVVVTANIGGSQYGAATTNTSGIFTIRNLSTGTYTVQPVLETGQGSSPTSVTSVISVSQTLHVGTFTVTGTMGKIAGSVTNNGEVVTSGALILASTNNLGSTPSTIYASSAPAQTPLYAVSSRADGTYELSVRGLSSYYVSVYVPVWNGSSIVTTTKTYSGISVNPGATTTRNIAIP